MCSTLYFFQKKILLLYEEFFVESKKSLIFDMSAHLKKQRRYEIACNNWSGPNFHFKHT